ncbi:DUF1648 domain-containing protein [Anaeromicropila herbilytica]|uniref:DUF1648 domain-containing protein n=1 Tax=Anaeromicropila herbilytica TaxID=2785025 RepID=A0A7R7EM21_9FIRM|nr:DUF1648 domain-containing protein [Anaeromicropila herbilytica]BCN31070.1 hypothetical protein bsdtb5_23650 [Anaeromicropila herbilytica]
MKVKRNKYNIFVEIVCLILLIGITIYLIMNWNSFPDKIPGHYNTMGQIDRMGNKIELLLLPVMAWLIYIGITITERFPQAWNTGVTVTEENKERVYPVLKNMISTTKLIVVAVFVFITVNSTEANSLPVWFLPTFVLLLVGSSIFFIIKLRKASK